jgi:hypothetical protein
VKRDRRRRRFRPLLFLARQLISLKSKGQMMAMLLQLFTAAPLKNYRTQVLGGLVFLTALANWLVGDMSFIEFMQNLPAMVGGLGLSTLGAKINDAKAVSAGAKTSKTK